MLHGNVTACHKVKIKINSKRISH